MFRSSTSAFENMFSKWKTNCRDQEQVSSGYEKLLADEGSAEEQQAHFRSSSRAQSTNYIRHFLFDLGFITAVLLVSYFTWSYVEDRRASKSLEWTSCGNSSAEAQEAGCHYEPMQRSWIPDACYFDDPVNDYHPFDDREWYYDLNLTQRLDEEGMRKLRTGDDLVAYTHYFHNEHCVYCWRKLAIAVERHLPMIDSKTADIHHSTHCAHLLTEEVKDVGKEQIEQYKHQATQSPLMFQTCVPLRWR